MDVAIKQLQDAYSRFRMREARAAPAAGARVRSLTRALRCLPQPQSRLLQQRVRLQKKLPEVKKALDTVTLLLSKQVRGCSLSLTPARGAELLSRARRRQGSAEASSVEFQLTDNIFAKARVLLCAAPLHSRCARVEASYVARPQAVLQDTRSVCLWLGANVMLEYTLEEVRRRLSRRTRCLRTCAAA